MKATDLRIGSLIMFNYAGSSDNLKWKEISVSANTIVHVSVYPDMYKPIKLTKEWLCRFGFKYDEFLEAHVYNAWLCVEDGLAHINFDAYRGLDNKIEWMEIPITVEYVHQIQNLYHGLTGEELKFT